MLLVLLALRNERDLGAYSSSVRDILLPKELYQVLLFSCNEAYCEHSVKRLWYQALRTSSAVVEEPPQQNTE